MFERLAKNGREFEEKTFEHVQEYADAGLRTLILAYRELDEETYREFDEKFSMAKNSVRADREQLIDEVSDKIERNLILLGATAVEDKLQNGVRSNNAFCFALMEINIETRLNDVSHILLGSRLHRQTCSSRN